jgi:hypothetical protein
LDRPIHREEDNNDKDRVIRRDNDDSLRRDDNNDRIIPLRDPTPDNVVPVLNIDSVETIPRTMEMKADVQDSHDEPRIVLREDTSPQEQDVNNNPNRMTNNENPIPISDIVAIDDNAPSSIEAPIHPDPAVQALFKGYTDGFKEGHDKGFDEGYKSGYDAGYELGLKAGKEEHMPGEHHRLAMTSPYPEQELPPMVVKSTQSTQSDEPQMVSVTSKDEVIMAMNDPSTQVTMNKLEDSIMRNVDEIISEDPNNRQAAQEVYSEVMKEANNEIKADIANNGAIDNAVKEVIQRVIEEKKKEEEVQVAIANEESVQEDAAQVDNLENLYQQPEEQLPESYDLPAEYVTPSATEVIEPTRTDGTVPITEGMDIINENNTNEAQQQEPAQSEPIVTGNSPSATEEPDEGSNVIPEPVAPHPAISVTAVPIQEGLVEQIVNAEIQAEQPLLPAESIVLAEPTNEETTTDQVEELQQSNQPVENVPVVELESVPENVDINEALGSAELAEQTPDEKTGKTETVSMEDLFAPAANEQIAVVTDENSQTRSEEEGTSEFEIGTENAGEPATQDATALNLEAELSNTMFLSIF